MARIEQGANAPARPERTARPEDGVAEETATDIEPDGENAQTPPGDGTVEGDASAAREVFVRVMPAPTTVYLRENGAAHGHLLARTERGIALIEESEDPETKEKSYRERWIEARDIRSVTHGPPGSPPATPTAVNAADGAPKAGRRSRWPGFVLRHEDAEPAGAVEAGATGKGTGAGKTRDVGSEDVVVFPRFRAHLEKGRYVIDGLAMPDEGESGAETENAGPPENGAVAGQ